MQVFTGLLPILLRPMASLLAIALGWKFLEGEIGTVFTKEDPTPEDAKKQVATLLGMIGGIALGGLIMGGLGGKRGRR